VILEGPGFLIHHSPLGPWKAWIASEALDGGSQSVAPAPFAALRTLGQLAGLFPGGLDLIWDRPPAWFAHLTPVERCGFWEAAGGIQGLVLHFREAGASEVPNGSFRGWIHSAEPPTGPLGEAWRHGSFGWVQDPAGPWTLPGTGRVPFGEDELPGLAGSIPPGCLWGELTLPVGALAQMDGQRLGDRMEEVQAGIERAMGHRFSIAAWPSAFPFQRRRTGWRISLLGGAEFQAAGGDWERAAEALQALLHTLERQLKFSIQVGPGFDLSAGKLLGRQALRDGLPWRNSLPLPPQPGAFAPGLGADPRKPSPLEARAALPPPLQPLMGDPPLALLRVPSPPTDGAARAFVASLGHPVALRWLPPGQALPCLPDPEQPWAPTAEFPLPPAPGGGTQGALFPAWEP